MKVVSIVNQKGGCGKTITAVNISAALSKKGHKVLLIDLDPQAHATFSLKKEGNLTITDILESIFESKELIWERTYLSVSNNFYLIPSSIGLASLEHRLTTREDKLQMLSSFLRKISADFEYCILDCPPSLGIITLNALEASNYSIIPLSICHFSLKGVEILKEIIIMLKEFKDKAPTPFYLLTQVEKRSNFSQEFMERVKNQLGNLLLNTVIRANIHLREAASKGKTIFEHKPYSYGAEDFMMLGDEIKKITSQSGWTSLFLKGNNFEEAYAIGDFNNWQREENYKLKKVANDIWSINIPLEKGKYRYKFLIGDRWVADPYNKLSEDDTFGGKNSLIVVD